MGVQAINFASFKSATGGGGFDPDAEPYINALAALGIVDSTINDAWNTYVIGAKATADAFWSEIIVECPLAGGTAAAHAINAKNPGTYNGTMNGTGMTHNANGVTGNGVTGLTYIDTNFNQSTDGAEDDEHVSVYSRTDFDGSSYLLGVADSSGHGTTLRCRFAGLFQTKSQCSTQNSPAATNSLGYLSINRTASAGYRKRQNSTNVDVTQSSDIAPVNANFYILAQNRVGSGALSHAAFNICWYGIGRGLTEAQDAYRQTLIEAFQDSLSRGVV